MNYHLDYEYLNHSMLRLFDKSPAKYRGIITGEIPPDPSTPDQLTGQLVHKLALEPDKLEEEFLVADLKSRRGKAWEAVVFDAEEEGKTPVLRSQIIHATAMRNALEASDLGRFYFFEEHDNAERIVETPIRCGIDGVKRKAMPDNLLLSKHSAINVDLKTSVDPTPFEFGRAAAKWGYHTQSAWYEDCIMKAHDLHHDSIKTVIVAIGKNEPYDVYAYAVTDEHVDAGRRLNRARVNRLKECRESGVWLSPAQVFASDLMLPKYAVDNIMGGSDD